MGTAVRRALSASFATALVAAVGLLAAPAASADSWVGGCTWADINQEACVQATMGGKDTSTHKQWVGWVRAYDLNHNGGPSQVTRLEAWGDGFYFSANQDGNGTNQEAMWGAQRWVSSGTNVCARVTWVNGATSTACIHVTV